MMCSTYTQTKATRALQRVQREAKSTLHASRGRSPTRPYQGGGRKHSSRLRQRKQISRRVTHTSRATPISVNIAANVVINIRSTTYTSQKSTMRELIARARIVEIAVKQAGRSVQLGRPARHRPMNAWDLQRRRGRQNDNQATGVWVRDQPNLTESSQHACANTAPGAVWPCHSEQNSLEMKKGEENAIAHSKSGSNRPRLPTLVSAWHPAHRPRGKAKLSAHTFASSSPYVLSAV